MHWRPHRLVTMTTMMMATAMQALRSVKLLESFANNLALHV